MATIRTDMTKNSVPRINRENQIQSGTIPVGASAGTFRVPLNDSTPSYYEPNSYLGPTASFTFPVDALNEDASLLLSGNWVDLVSSKVKSGDHIALKRGNILNSFTVKYVTTLNEDQPSVQTLVRLAATPQDLANFIGASGFPYISNESLIFLGGNAEIATRVPTLLKDLTYKQYTLDQKGENFNVDLNWEADHAVKAVMIRWRSKPRFQGRKSIVQFQVATGGTYTVAPYHDILFPTANVKSNTGKGAKLKLTGTILDTTIVSGGTAYPPGPGLLILLDGGDGTGASVDAFVAGPGPFNTSVTAINLYTGGTGYTHVPAMGFTGGIGASAFFSSATISNVIELEDGGGYLSVPTVEMVGGSGSGGSVFCSYFELQQSGSIDYVRVIDQGTDYTDAAYVIISGGGGTGATASLVIENGKIKDVHLISGGKEYTSVPTATVYDMGGTGASLSCNVDYLSEWNYEPAIYELKRTTISNLKKMVPYEFQILVSTDVKFRGSQKYSDSYDFGYFQA